MGRLGFEPRTNRLKAECSTAELATRFIFHSVCNHNTGFCALQLKFLSVEPGLDYGINSL